MATPQLSPGVLTREVDLTVGRVSNVLNNYGAIAGPFIKGPVLEPTIIENEQQLIDIFGLPQSNNGQYEYWMSASSFMTYGGALKVVRVDDQELKNAAAIRNSSGVSIAVTSISITNATDYENNHVDDTDFAWAAKNPGTWGNNLKVCVIDGHSDQILTGITTSADVEQFEFVDEGNLLDVEVGIAATFITLAGDQTATAIPGKVLSSPLSGVISTGTTITSSVHLAGFTTVFLSQPTLNETEVILGSVDIGIIQSTGFVDEFITVGSVGLSSVTNVNSALFGESVSGDLKFIVTEVGEGYVNIKISSFIKDDGTEVHVDYRKLDSITSIVAGNDIRFFDEDTELTSLAKNNITEFEIKDWYDQQLLDISTPIYWKSIAPRPSTTSYGREVSSRNDEIHVIVVDDTGEITGARGNILEKHIGLSKSKLAISAVNAPEKIWWKDYIANYSQYVYAGVSPSAAPGDGEVSYPSGFALGSNVPEEGAWDNLEGNTIYSSIGSVTYNLLGGHDYGVDNGMGVDLDSIKTGYELFSNRDEIEIDYLIMGPGLTELYDSQYKAAYLIGIANTRKDCIAVISPHRDAVVGKIPAVTQTNKVIEFFSSLPSSSYVVFDSGYKYTFDRFNNRFRYIPCNADIAGLIFRTSIEGNFWESPAGQTRGVLNNAIKLAYNPSKLQRDLLYQERINPVILKKGVGVVLYGDKTGLGYQSAFDRINVRTTFLTIEQAISSLAESQLFRINNDITRNSFRNIVESYLNNIQARGGVYGFLVQCDSTNNTPDIIDNNEFVATIRIKPVKSINYVTLTFVATRTGASFDEIV